MARRSYSTHRCVLEQKSNSGLPLLAPQTPQILRWLRSFRKWFLVYEHHYLTSKLFRSSCMLMQEKKRQIKTVPWFIIHPFSKLNIIIEVIMTFVWIIILFLDLFVLAYFSADQRQVFTHDYYLYIFEVLNLIYISLCFISGYLEVSTNEIILSPHQIAINYVSSYFILDVLGSIPLITIVMTTMTMKRSSSVTIATTAIKCSRLVRLKTMMEYSRQITQFLKISDNYHKIGCMVVIYLYLIHWSACIFYLIPRIEFADKKRYTHNSWVVQANIQNSRVLWKYLLSLHTTLCHFIGAGAGMYKIREKKDQIVCSFISAFGWMYTAYMTAVVLQMVSSTSASESKYEELVHNLSEYSIRKKMPQTLKLRLLLYYENRFQKRYFRESAILSTLSEHLRYEILLHSCKHLFEKLTIFHGLSKVVLGTIIACLKQEVYLPNDVVMKSDSPADCMYLIGYGTLALYTSDGMEIMHIEDGEHIGETGLLRPELDKLLNVVAVETSELFRLDKVDFFYILHRYEDFAQRLQKTVAQDVEIVNKLHEHLSRLHGKHDILNDLRNGKILEKSYRRHGQR